MIGEQLETPRETEPVPPTQESRHRPADLGKLAEFLRGPLDVRSLALTGLFILAVLYTLKLGRQVFLPIVLAALLNMMLAPVVESLRRWHVPRAVGAAAVLLLTLGIAGVAVWGSLEPAQEWLNDAPQKMRRVELRLRGLMRPVEQVTEAAEGVDRLAGDDESTVKVQQEPSFSDSLFTGMRSFVATSAVMLTLLYFLLASGDFFLRKLVTVLPKLRDKKRAVEIARRIETDISTHLITIAGINLCLGTAIGIAFYLLGMPSPVFWGAAAALLNFVPYLGALVGIGLSFAVALLNFDDPSRALTIAGVYFGITALEGSFLTPTILGQRLSLNPVVVFLAVFFWGWLWGIPGVLLAVPIMIAIKIFCDRIEPLSPIGEFLGR